MIGIFRNTDTSNKIVLYISIINQLSNFFSLFSQVDIAEGEEVTITYTNLLRPAQYRNENLNLQWHFTCTCKRCESTRMVSMTIALFQFI